MTSRQDRPSLHGILVIDKPAGWTSHDVVGWVRKWSGQRKVGHGGTLDPAATGVLPVALNDGTRVLEFLTETQKAYVAEITFGVATDSADIDGVVTRIADPVFSTDELNRAVDRFRGPIVQIPPMHSAVRIDGKRAYKRVRGGETFDVPSREVTISRLEIVEWLPPVLTTNIECSKGTYIRAIARDLGEALGCGAFLSNLVRTRTGRFSLADAWPISELAEISAVAEWPTLALHPDQGVAEWPAIVLDDIGASDWQFGRPVQAIGRHEPETRCRVYDSAGNWFGLGSPSIDGMNWRPLRVIGIGE